MTNIYVACWTMSENMFNGQVGTARVNTLQNIALHADNFLRQMGNQGGGDYTRMLIVPEYVFTAGGTILAKKDKHQIYRQLEDISRQVPKLIIIAGSIAYKKGVFFKDTYNVCPILFDGRIYKKLYKEIDDEVYQVNGTFRTKTDGGKGVPVATIDGVSIGLDICMDYTWERLGNYLKAHNDVAAPDIHIQISGTNGADRGRAQCKNGGVYLHCDLGDRGEGGATAWRVTGMQWGKAATTEVLPSLTQPIAFGWLKYFAVPV